MLAASNEWTWIPDGAMHARTDELLVVAYPAWIPFRYGAKVFDSARDPAGLIADVEAVVRAWGGDRVWWTVSDTTRPEGLEPELLRRGAEVVERMDVLAVPLPDGRPDLGVPGDVLVRQVVDEQTVRDFYEVSNDAFLVSGGTTEEQVAVALIEIEKRVEEGRVVSYVDGRPAGCGGWTLAGPVCRLWGGASHRELRGRGAYRAALGERPHLAAAAGATLALTHGVVTTSSPILRRTGFRRYGEQRVLVADMPPA